MIDEQRFLELESTVKNMVNEGAVEFIELGPGDVLKGLVKKISADVTVG